jgi:hypothetical protein
MKAVIAPECISASERQFIDALYSDSQTNSPENAVTRVFSFKKNVCFALILSTYAIEPRSGRSGQKLSIGFGVSDLSLLLYPRLISFLMHFLVDEISKELDISIIYAGAQKIVEALQHDDHDSHNDNGDISLREVLSGLRRVQDRFEIVRLALVATQGNVWVRRLIVLCRRLLAVLFIWRRRRPALIIGFSPEAIEYPLMCFDALIADMATRIGSASAIGVPSQNGMELSAATRIVILPEHLGSIHYKRAKILGAGKKKTIVIFR